MALNKLYSYLPLSWRSQNWRSDSSMTVDGSNMVRSVPDAVITVYSAPDDGWKYHPKHVEQFAGNKKLYIVASCWTIIDISTCSSESHLSWSVIHIWSWSPSLSFFCQLCLPSISFCILSQFQTWTILLSSWRGQSLTSLSLSIAHIDCLSFRIISHHHLSVIHQTDGFLKIRVFWDVTVCCWVGSSHYLNGSLVSPFRVMHSWTSWPWIPWHYGILKCLNCSPEGTGSHERELESSFADNFEVCGCCKGWKYVGQINILIFPLCVCVCQYVLIKCNVQVVLLLIWMSAFQINWWNLSRVQNRAGMKLSRWKIDWKHSKRSWSIMLVVEIIEVAKNWCRSDNDVKRWRQIMQGAY